MSLPGPLNALPSRSPGKREAVFLRGPRESAGRFRSVLLWGDSTANLLRVQARGDVCGELARRALAAVHRHRRGRAVKRFADRRQLGQPFGDPSPQQRARPTVADPADQQVLPAYAARSPPPRTLRGAPASAPRLTLRRPARARRRNRLAHSPRRPPRPAGTPARRQQRRSPARRDRCWRGPGRRSRRTARPALWPVGGRSRSFRLPAGRPAQPAVSRLRLCWLRSGRVRPGARGRSRRCGAVRRPNRRRTSPARPRPGPG